GYSESSRLFRARARCRSSATSQILGTPRRHEPRTPLARPGQGAASARIVGSGLRVVHGGVRHARSEGGEGVVAQIVSIDTRATKHGRPAVPCAAFKLLV